jgi:hypothetical protein
MVKIKILLLCHGNKHEIHGGYNVGFPLTRQIIDLCTTLDISKESEPDILENFIMPTKIKKNTFNVVAGLYCYYNVLIDSHGNLVKNYFDNVTKILKPKGLLFINNLPLIGLCAFSQFLLNNKLYSTTINKTNKKLWHNKPLPVPIKKTELLTKNILVKINKKISKTKDGEIIIDVNPNDKNDVILKYKNQLFYLFILYIQHVYPHLELIINTKDINNVLTTILDDTCDDHLKQQVLNWYKTGDIYFSFIFRNNK